MIELEVILLLKLVYKIQENSKKSSEVLKCCYG